MGMIPNIDPETGIRYGVINANSVDPFALDDIVRLGIDEIYEELCAEIESVVDEELANLRAYGPVYNIVNALLARLSDVIPYSTQLEKALVAQVEEVDTEHCRDVIIEWLENELSDSYEAQDTVYRYEEDGYKILFLTGSNNLMVLKSPYTTAVRLCSPCYPNAGDLDSPDTKGFEAYALEPDWFEEI